ncbi:MAG: alpha/beta hydrolase [Alphaproteobacteria bacterium]
MTANLAISGPAYGPEAGGSPRQLIVLLHGLCADGNDLIGLAPRWAGSLPHAEFVAPHAPFPCDMGPFGYQWFSVSDSAPESLLARVRAAAGILDAFIDAELGKRELADADLAFVGFSQGAMLSLHVAPRRTHACAAVVGYSGMLVDGDSLAREIRSRPPVLLCHGDSDPVVPPQSLGQAEATLSGLGVRVRAHMRPGLAHGIDEEGLRLGGDFLRGVFVAEG